MQTNPNTPQKTVQQKPPVKKQEPPKAEQKMAPKKITTKPAPTGAKPPVINEPTLSAPAKSKNTNTEIKLTPEQQAIYKHLMKAYRENRTLYNKEYKRIKEKGFCPPEGFDRLLWNGTTSIDTQKSHQRMLNEQVGRYTEKPRTIQDFLLSPKRGQ